jgi:cytochrome oxidase Cu insertion factor (SCO1/SenC/PrrC family)
MRRSPIVFRTVPLVVLAVFAGVVAVDAAVTLHRADALRSAPAGTLPDGQALDRRAPPLPLLDEGGRATSLEAFRGRYVVMAPFLTLCHETCPLTIGALIGTEDWSGGSRWSRRRSTRGAIRPRDCARSGAGPGAACTS